MPNSEPGNEPDNSGALLNHAPEMLAHVSTAVLTNWRSRLLTPSGLVDVLSQLARELLTREIEHPARKLRDPPQFAERAPSSAINTQRRFAADVSPPVV